MKVGNVTERTDLIQGPSLLDTDELDRSGIDLGATGRYNILILIIFLHFNKLLINIENI